MDAAAFLCAVIINIWFYITSNACFHKHSKGFDCGVWIRCPDSVQRAGWAHTYHHMEQG